MSRRKTNSEFLEQIKDRPFEALEPYQTAKNKIRFKCTAEGCGHEWVAMPHSIISGCGCPKCGDRRASNKATKTNQQFLEQIKDRDLIAMEPYQKDRIKIAFRCTAEGCGHEWRAQPSNILSGRGCPLCGNRRMSEAKRKENEIIVEDNGVVLIDISTPAHPDAIMICDKENWDRYRGGRVYAYVGDRTKYIYAGYKEGGRLKGFHRFVLTPPDGFETDHIKHGDFTYIDNTRSNLRICTTSQNAMNRSLQSNNKSGATGIYRHNSAKKWVARIKVNRKTIHLGYFQSKEDAVSARKEAETRYFKQFAYSENN